MVSPSLTLEMLETLTSTGSVGGGTGSGGGTSSGGGSDCACS